MSNIQTGAERMPHDLSHLGFLAGQIGRLITISTTPVIAGDSFEMDAVGALRLSPLRRGLAIDSTVDIFTFYVLHRHVYGEQWIKFMKDGVNATPLPTVNTTGYIDHAAFLGTINPDTNKFFFSSRRRHTSLVSDWSSDVCSSDLARSRPALASSGRRVRQRPRQCAAFVQNLSSGKSSNCRRPGCARRRLQITCSADPFREIGRASCRERVWMSGGEGA